MKDAPMKDAPMKDAPMKDAPMKDAAMKISSTRTKRRRARRTRWALGYTMIEVMMALAILAIGGTGVISLQKASVLSGLNSRNLTAASMVAGGWLEKGKTEAIAWTVNPPVPATNPILTMALTNPTTWQDIPGGGGSAVDGTPTAAGIIYCSQVRGALLGPAATADTMRFEVRTMFARAGRTIDAECATMTASLTANPDQFGVIYFTGSVKRNSQ